MTDKRKNKQHKSNRKKSGDSSVIENRDEFRRRSGAQGTGHPSYIYRKQGSTFEYIGVTHSPITRGVKNIKLDKNPNPNDKTDTYVKPKPERDSVKQFQKQALSIWKLADSDKPKIEKIKNKGIKNKKTQNKKSGNN